MKKAKKPERNIPLIIMAIIVIIIDLAILGAVAMSSTGLGWWAVAIAAGALSSIGLAITAIKRNDPAWLLLDLILPN